MLLEQENLYGGDGVHFILSNNTKMRSVTFPSNLYHIPVAPGCTVVPLQ